MDRVIAADAELRARLGARRESAFERSAQAFHAGGRLSARAPLEAGARIEVGDDGASVSLRLRGAGPVKPVDERGRLLYERPLPSTDLVISTGADALEAALVVEDDDAPRRFTFDVETKGLRVEPDRNGGWLFVSGVTPIYRLPEPYARDGEGRRVALVSSLEEGTLTISLPAGVRYPLVVDPAVLKVSWVNDTSAAQPQAVYGGVAGYSPGTQSIWYTAGHYETGSPGNYGYNDNWDTFRWSGSAWSTVSGSAGLPDAYQSDTASMAWDANRSTMVLVFNHSTSTFRTGVRESTGSSGWVEKCETSPCKDNAPFEGDGRLTAFYNPTRSRVQVWGTGYGAYCNTGTTNVEEWTGLGWNHITTTGGPSIRSGFAAAFDTARNVLVVFGGTQKTGCGTAGTFQKFGDTWEWNGTSWRNAASSGPPPSDTARMVFDQARRRAVLVDRTGTGLDTYEWDGSAWTKTAPSGAPASRFGFTLTYDAGRKKVVLIGGSQSEFVGGPSSTVFRETWTYSGIGSACSSNADCNGGTTCIDGVCCTAACGMCQACNLATPGTCSAVSAGQKDPDSCPGAQTCDGAGGCKKDNGQACTDGSQCVSSNCADGVCCNSACLGSCDVCNGSSPGTCTNAPATAGGSPTSCSPYLCSGNSAACATSCTGDAQCAATAHCSGGKCVPDLANGAACTNDAQCASTACVDGVCCGSRCGGPCDVCSAAKGAPSDGVCSFLPRGSDGSPSCSPYVCAGNAGVCSTTCVNNGDCSPGSICRSGECIGKFGLGAACTGGAQCNTGQCVDGVCCDGPCTGVCQACSIATKASGDGPGLCGAAKAGQDPHDDCADDGVASCDRTGFCDGAGACAMYPSGASCGPPSCSGDPGTALRVAAYTCDGAGTCDVVAASECGLFGCVSQTCLSECTDDGDCVGAAFCEASLCIGKKADGLGCSENRECSSNLCVDGVCCDAACRGQCEACNVPGAVGQCTPVVRTPVAPRPACPAGGSDPCAAAQCDGETRGSCAGYVGPEVTCREPSCEDGTETPAGLCDGKGGCRAPARKDCEPFICGEASLCKTTCASDDDCADGYKCDAASAKCVAGTRCEDDQTEVDPRGAEKSCGAYRCQAGRCNTECTTTDNCAAGNFCNGSGECVKATVASDDGGCAVRGPRRNSAGGQVTAAMLALFVFGASRARSRTRAGDGEGSRS